MHGMSLRCEALDQPLRRAEWVVHSKHSFGAPEAVLAYLSRYTHRVAIANSRLIALDESGVTFKWKDYRSQGRERHKTMSLAVPEFIRRFLIHVLPKGFRRIRHYGLFNNTARADSIARIRARYASTSHSPNPIKPIPTSRSCSAIRVPAAAAA
jgi:Putative transposase